MVRAPAMPGKMLLGNLSEMATDPLEFLTRCQRQCGDVARIRLGWQTIHLLSHPEHIGAVFANREGHYRKRRVEFRALGVLIGRGLLTTDGDLWKGQRKMMQPLFTWQALARYGPDMTSLTAKLVDRWRPLAKAGTAVDVAAGMTDLTLAVVAKTLLGTDFNETTRELKEAIVFGIEYADSFDSLITLPPWVPTPRNRRFAQAKGLLDSVVYGMIDRRRQRLDEGHDLLSVLVRATDEDTGVGMTNEMLRDQVMTIFLAGHETTAQSLSWLLYLLGQHPEIQEAVRAEVDRVLGGRTPTFDDLANMEFTKQTIQESMRLYPAVWAMGREVVKTHEVGGFQLDAGTEVFFSQWVMHRHPDWWDEPEKFDPDRFSSARSVGRSLGTYFPFGGGNRVCIGQTFAMTEMQLIVPMLLQAFRFELVPDQRVMPKTSITLRPANGILMRLVER